MSLRPTLPGSPQPGYLARVLGEAAVSAARTDTFLGERYRRIARRRVKKRAIVAVGRSILVIIWALLSTPKRSSSTSARTTTPPAPTRNGRVRHHIRELQALGYTVTLNPAARPGAPGDFRITRRWDSRTHA